MNIFKALGEMGWRGLSERQSIIIIKCNLDGFMGRHQLPAVIFKATSIIQKIGFQLMVCYKSHLIKLHAYFLCFFPKSTWKSCNSCLRGTEPGWPTARSSTERRGRGACACLTSGEPPTSAPRTTRDASTGQRSHPATSHLAWRAGLGPNVLP